MLLAIDTSTSLASASLYDGQVRWEQTWWAGRQHSAQVMPQIHAGMQLLGLSPGQLVGVAAAVGPGSFTGVRVGISLAKGLAFGLRVPAFGVCSLDVVAAECQLTRRRVQAVLDAGRGRFATALYRVRPRSVERLEPIRLVDLPGLARLARRGVVLCGEVVHVTGDLESQIGQQPPQFLQASPAASARRAGYLAELAWDAWLAGQRPGPEELQPIYLSEDELS